MNGKQIALMGLVAVGMFWLLRAQAGTQAVAGATIQDTAGINYRLFRRSDGAIVDQYGGVWV
jgi:hypothetical protein